MTDDLSAPYSPCIDRSGRASLLCRPLHADRAPPTLLGGVPGSVASPTASPHGHLNLKPLFERLYPRLVRYLSRRLGDRDLAEDIAQEAFVRLLRVLPDNPDAWLFVVASNLARDAVRADARRTRRLTLLHTTSSEVQEFEAERGIIATETAVQVQEALTHLSERDRSLLLMHEEGVSYRALAEAIHVQPNSIAPLLARARARLLRALARQGGTREHAAASA